MLRVRVHRPLGPRKSGNPAPVLTPAPVSTQIFRASVIRAWRRLTATRARQAASGEPTEASGSGAGRPGSIRRTRVMRRAATTAMVTRLKGATSGGSGSAPAAAMLHHSAPAPAAASAARPTAGAESGTSTPPSATAVGTLLATTPEAPAPPRAALTARPTT